jgi:hypothetical protein
MRASTTVAGLIVTIAASGAIATARVDARAQQSQTGQTQTPPPVPVPCAFPGACAPPSTAPKTDPKSDPKSADPAKASDANKTAAQPKPSDPPPPSTIDTPNVVSTAPLSPPPQPVTPGAPTEQMLGVKVYPNSQFLQSVDAGRGQRYYLYGTNAPYPDIVKYYQSLLKNGGRELIKLPPMQQFDLSKFQDQTMVFQPSVVVKDYSWNNSTGYLYIEGGREQRFKTVIQIVPGPAGPAR